MGAGRNIGGGGGGGGGGVNAVTPEGRPAAARSREERIGVAAPRRGRSFQP